MLKKVLNHLLPKKSAAKLAAQLIPRKEPRFPLGNGFYWEFEEVRNGYGGYKVVDAYLLKIDDPSFRRCIVNRSGEIQNFPGFRNRIWEKLLDIPQGDEQVKFTFWISPYREGKASVRWMIQPDGRYFADEDGYGAEHCVEITVHSFLDEDGKFTEPFDRK